MAEPLKATFFALKHRDRAVLLPATVTYAVIVLLIAALFMALSWGSLQNLLSLMRSAPAAGEMAETQAMNLVTGMLGMFGWLLLLLFPFYFATAAYEAACLRWMIRGEAPGLFGLRFDYDMWRVYGVYWVWYLAQIVVSYATSMLMVPFIFMMMGDILATPEPEAGSVVGLMLGIQALSLLQFLPLAFIAIRFGPAAATSIARKQFSFFEAWKVTRNRFWALFGSYLILWVLFAAAYIILFATLYAPIFGPFFVELFASWPSIPADTPQRYFDLIFAPSTWVVMGLGYLLGLVLTLVYVVLSYGINARAALAAIEEGKIEGAV